MPGPGYSRRQTGNPYPNLAAQFVSASSQRLSITDAAQVGLNPGTSDFAFSFWVNLTTAAASQCLFSKGAQADSAPEAPGYRIFATTTPQINVTFGDTGDGTRKQLVCTTTNLVVGTWMHVVINFNRAGNLAPVINTTAQNTLAIATEAAAVTTTAPFELGDSNASTGANATLFLNGLLDCFGFWTRVLTVAEIAYLYRSGVGTAFRDLDGGLRTNLVSWWNLDGTGLDSAGPNNLTSVNNVGYTGGKR